MATLRHAEMKIRQQLIIKHKEYKYFIVDIQNRILSGWQFKQDAKDSQLDLPLVAGKTKIYTRKNVLQLIKRGLND